MNETKNILMVACAKKVEALRMASGLTLLDDRVEIAVWGAPPAGAEAEVQKEALDFADVPIAELDRDADALAARILASDVVFCV